VEKNKIKIRVFSSRIKLIFLPVVGMYLGALLLFAWYKKLPLYPFVDKYGIAVIGATLFVFSYFYVFLLMKKTARLRNFIDVDESRSNKASKAYKRINTKIINGNISSISTFKTKACAHKLSIEKPKLSIETLNSYLLKLTSIIEEKANFSDKKASLLLDRGVKYSRNGIIFYIVSILIWQILAWIKGGIQVQFIYGIASCSFLFIFIEFLSAWFLKQYRHFIDNSTYLIKVKSIFDKYMLTILALKELSNVEEISTESVNIIVDMLKEDIKWPDAQIHDINDISFAKEALESITDVLKHVVALKAEPTKKDTV